MQVGDLVVSRDRYRGQFFIVIGLITTDLPVYVERVQCLRIEDGYKTRWCKASTWKAI